MIEKDSLKQRFGALYLTMEHILGSTRIPGTFIDIGCRHAELYPILKMLSPSTTYYGIDPDKEALEVGQREYGIPNESIAPITIEQLATYCKDPESIPEELSHLKRWPTSFDNVGILLFALLPKHAESYQSAMKEFLSGNEQVLMSYSGAGEWQYFNQFRTDIPSRLRSGEEFVRDKEEEEKHRKEYKVCDLDNSIRSALRGGRQLQVYQHQFGNVVERKRVDRIFENLYQEPSSNSVVSSNMSEPKELTCSQRLYNVLIGNRTGTAYRQNGRDS